MGVIAPEVQALALGVIEDIEKYGHYQGEGAYWTVGGTSRPCCVVANPTCAYASDDWKVNFWDAWANAAGTSVLEAVNTNDALTTDEVLDALWAVALGDFQ